MAGVTFVHTLRRNWRQILYWGIGIGLLGMYVAIIVQDADILKQYAELAKNVPPALLQMFGMNDTAALATPEGFISFGFFGYTLLILAVYAVIAGMSVTANEEDDGILDVVLALPIPRWRVVVERFFAYALIATAIVAVAFGGLWLGILSSALDINVSRMVEGSINMMPSFLLMIAFTMFVGVVARRKAMALAAAAIFIVGSYFINFLGSAASGSLADTLQAVSFFSYYNSEDVLLHGLNAGNVGLLLTVTAALVVGTVWSFNRRDVGL
ncbi:MAG: ABC transporter permease subunit [Chloroflexi bacterium]|nr:ABC transporter permease subunit [Chloroflexota bacterium]